MSLVFCCSCVWLLKCCRNLIPNRAENVVRMIELPTRYGPLRDIPDLVYALSALSFYKYDATRELQIQ